MKKLGYVYMITSPTGRIYIGSTKNIQNRIKSYRTLNCKNQVKLYNSLLKYGWENHIFEVIMECLIEEVLRYECILGNYFNVLDKHEGLNLVLPKISDLYRSVSEETINRQSEARKGKRLSQVTKNKIAIASKNRIWKDSSKKKISDSKKGKPRPQYVIDIIKDKDKKIIIQYDLQDIFIKEWFGVYSTARELKLHPSALANCCRGLNKTCGGFKWKYK
jgi:group I intron endonuclease